MKKGLADKAGYQHVEWTISYENTTMGNFSCGLTWMDRAMLLEDAEAFQQAMAVTLATQDATALRA